MLVDAQVVLVAGLAEDSISFQWTHPGAPRPEAMLEF